jgi:hypothetical protein
VRDHDDPGTPVAQRPERGHAGSDPSVVGDPVAVQRDVEVGPDQDPPAAKLAEVVDRRGA